MLHSFDKILETGLLELRSASGRRVADGSQALGLQALDLEAEAASNAGPTQKAHPQVRRNLSTANLLRHETEEVKHF